MKVLIWCGGRGARAHPLTCDLPKPMLPLGGVPVLRHIMDIYARQGVCDFVLATGFRAEVIAAYTRQLPTNYRAQVVDTGEDADTGERLALCLDRLGDTFHATYGDGLGNVDLLALSQVHQRFRGATVTAVPMPSQFGTLDLVDDRVVGFAEKPALQGLWISAGFFVFDRCAVAGLEGTSLERDLLPILAASGRLHVFRHGGFWRSLDTYKDHQELDALATTGAPPWLP